MPQLQCIMERSDFMQYHSTASITSQAPTNRGFRSPSIIPKQVSAYVTQFNNVLSQQTDPSIIAAATTFKKNLLSECAYYNTHVEDAKIERTFNLLSFVEVDRFNLLEMSRAMKYKLTYTAVYSLHDQLSLLLAFLLHEDYEQLDAKLKAACAQHNISYINLSRALLNADESLISNIPVELLYGLSDTLDSLIEMIIYRPEKCIFYSDNWSDVLDLSDTSFSNVERVTSYLIFKLAYLMQYIFNKFVTQHVNHLTGADMFLASKGVSNIVLHTNDFARCPQVDFVLEDTGVLKLRPAESSILNVFRGIV